MPPECRFSGSHRTQASPRLGRQLIDRHSWNGLAPLLGVAATLLAVACHDAWGPRPARVKAPDLDLGAGPGVWTTKASMPTARWGLGGGVVNGIVYAVGGAGWSTVLATVEAYDPATNTWTTKAPMPTARRTAVGVVNGTLYAVGGWSGSWVATVEAYDPATNTWTTKAPMPTARGAVAVGVVNGNLFAVGGSNGSVYLTTVEAYDPATNTWTTRAAMPTARGYLAAGAANGIVYALGGNGNGGPLATAEAYQPPANPVPAVPPDSDPANLYVDSLIVRGSPDLSAPFVRNTLVLLFKTGTPQSERQAAIDQINGRVVGGYPLADGDGFYLVSIADDGTTGPLFAAVAALEARASVEIASPHILVERPLNYLRPNDGSGWGKAAWTVFADSASGSNWAPEAIAAPLAWGCSTGDSTMTVAMVDHGVSVGVTDLDPNLSFTYRPNGFPTEDHASAVASVLAAVGNNGAGITGMLWHTKLRSYEAASFTSSGTPTMYHGLPVYIPSHTAAVVSAAAASGARVINVSMGYIWGLPPTFSKGDSASIRRVVQPMAAALRRIPASTSPLIVYS